MDLDVFYQELTLWLKIPLQEENMMDYDVKVIGTSEKGENYMGDIYFVDVVGKSKTEENNVLSLVIKTGKKNKQLREQMNVRSFYLREMAFYEEIMPAFKKFELTKDVIKPFSSIPKCYKVLKFDEMEVIILENLKKKNYQLYDRFKSMDLPHLRLVLKTYAKFHAISFAMKDQRKEEFDRITKNYTHLYEIFEKKIPHEFYKERLDKLVQVLNEDHAELAKKIKMVFEKGIGVVSLEIVKDKVKEYVVTHGDCWNNNFMFKYGSNKIPLEVSILDWQMSGLHSPVLDLSHFLYIVTSGEEAKKFDDLLLYYHENLSKFIKELGSDPTELFPLKTLAEHWRKYSIFGLVQAIVGMELLLSDKKDSVSFDDFDNPNDTIKAWINQVGPKNVQLYKERIVAVLECFFKGSLNNF